MNFELTYNDFDRRIWEEELQDFVPRKIFDVHTHLWDESCAGQDSPDSNLRLNAGSREMDSWSRKIFPGRELDYLFLGTPIENLNLERQHEFLAKEARLSTKQLASTIVLPEMSAEELDSVIRRYHFIGLKPYRLYAPDPANGRITDFLPEHLLEVADQHRLTVTLHLSRFDGIADPVNQDDLRYLTKRYPKVRWILAHCARAFHAFMLEKAVFVLRNIPNLWYDTSAVCEPYSHYLLFKYENLERVMFGSDNIAAGSDHGKYITWGKGWCFFRAPEQPHCVSHNTLVVYEQLRAMKQAADMAELSQEDIEAIFHRNAENFFGEDINLTQPLMGQ